MAVVIHAREVALQNTVPRILISNASITNTAGSFNKPATSSVLTPDTITLTVLHTFSAPTFSWEYALGNSPTTWVAFGTNSDTQIITKEAFAGYIGTSSFVIYRCTVSQSEYVDAIASINILYSVAAAESISFVLSNEAQVVPATVDGVVTDFTGAESALTVYQGVVDDTANWEFTASWVNIGGTILNEVVTVNTWTGEASSDLNFTEVLENTPSGYAELVLRPFPSDTDIGYVDIIAFRANYQSQLKRFVVTKVRKGDTGVGADGDIGNTGDSRRIAYSLVTGATLSTTPETIDTVGDNSVPADDSWGGGEVWSSLLPNFSEATAQSIYQTDGIYTAQTNTITWNAPYVSSLKVNKLSAITADLGTITAGNLTIDSNGFIRGGQTDWNTGTGFWLGYSGGFYKFSIGSSTVGMTWDGTSLNISGGNITIGTTGNIKGGMTSYAVGTGFFLGYEGGTYKFSVGSGANMLRWDGTTLYVPAANIDGLIVGGQIAPGAVTQPVLAVNINTTLSLSNPRTTVPNQEILVANSSLPPENSTCILAFSGYLELNGTHNSFSSYGYNYDFFNVNFLVNLFIVYNGTPVIIASTTYSRIETLQYGFLSKFPINLSGADKAIGGDITSIYLRVDNFSIATMAGPVIASINTVKLIGRTNMLATTT